MPASHEVGTESATAFDGHIGPEGYGMEPAQAVLGHSSVQTSQIYAEVNLQRAMEVAKKLGSIRQNTEPSTVAKMQCVRKFRVWCCFLQSSITPYDGWPSRRGDDVVDDPPLLVGGQSAATVHVLRESLRPP